MANANAEAVPRHDFGVIREQFDKLREAIGNRIDREWPGKSAHSSPAGRALILGLYKAAENYLAASRFLLADTPPNPSRRLEFALANPPLARVLLDALCTIVFLFESFKPRVAWHYKSGWLDVRRETDRLTAAYSADPDWAAELAKREEFLKETRTTYGISDDDLQKPKKLQFPNPDAMIRKHLVEGTERHTYLRYMVDWFYRELSQDSHLTFTGIGRSLPLLVPRDMSEAERAHRLELARFRQVSTSLVLMMCIITELELELRFGEQERIKYVWAVLQSWAPEAREVYRRFYEEYLGPASAELAK